MKSKMFLMSMFLLPFACFSQWEWQSPKPGGYILSVCFSDLYTGYTVGYDGMIFKTTDAGSNWSVKSFGNISYLKKLSFPATDTGYVIGYFGTVLKTTNGGESWVKLNTGTNYNFGSICFINADTGYIVGNSKLLLTTDGGLSWTTLPGLNGLDITSVDFVDENNGYVGSINGILKTTDGGNTWSQHEIDTYGYFYVRDMYFHSVDIGYVQYGSGFESELYKTIDGGITWTQFPPCYNYFLDKIYFYNNNIGYTVGNYEGSYIYKTNNGGSTWQGMGFWSDPPYEIFDIFQTSLNSIYAVGSNIALKYNGGFYNIQNGTNQNLNTVFFLNADTGYAAGNGYSLMKTTDGGANWNVLLPSTGLPNDEIKSMYFTDADHGLIVGGNYYDMNSYFIKKTNDGGQTWNTVLSSEDLWPYSVYFTDNQTGFALCNGLYKTIDGGETWSVFNPNVFGYDIFFLNNSIGYYINNHLFKTSNAGQNWSQLSNISNVSSFYFVNESIGFLTSGSNIYKTIDGGTTWYIVHNAPNTNFFKSIKFIDQNKGIALGNGSYITDDGGITWLYTSNSGNEVYLVDENNCYVVGDYGKILKNSDIFSNLNYTSPALIMSFSVTNISCNGNNNDGAINLIINGGKTPYSFLWTNGATTEDLINVASGSYSVTVTDANNVEIKHTIFLVEPDELSIVSNAYPCDVNSIDLTITGGTTPYSYYWSNGATSQNISNISEGTYTVTVTDTNGCTATNSNTIAQPSVVLNVSASLVNVLCYGNSTGSIDVTLSGGASPYSCLWSNDATTQDISYLASGYYFLLLTDSFSCNSFYSYYISQPDELNITKEINQVSCLSCCDASINISANGGTSPYFYNWSNGNTTNEIINLCNDLYIVTITDANGCILIDSTIFSTFCQNLSMNSGWNIYSTYINPFNTFLDSILSPVISEIIIMKNNIGSVYWPQFGVNNIQNWQIGEGYQIRMTQVCNFNICGSKIIPELQPVNLNQNWNMIAYLRSSAASIDNMLNSIVSNIILVKTGLGLVYWPSYSINQIVNMNPGLGYLIKTNASCTLLYPPDSENTAKEEIAINKPTHFSRPQNTNNLIAFGILSSPFTVHSKQVSNISNISSFYFIDESIKDDLGEYGKILKNNNILLENTYAEEVYSPQPDIQPANNVNIVASNTEAFTYYYNATSKMLYISSDKNTTNTSVQILDMNGKLVLPAINLNQRTISINASSLSKGVYVLKMNNQQKVECKKLIIN